MANKQLAQWGPELERLKEQNSNLVIDNFAWKKQLQNERADREANKELAPTVAKLPHLADVFSELKKKREKSRAQVADVEVVLEIVRRSLTVE